MWTQHWPVKELNSGTGTLIVENGGKHPCGPTAILYTRREKEGRGLRSIEEEYKVTKIKGGSEFMHELGPSFGNGAWLQERAETLGHKSLAKEAARYADEVGLQLQLEHPNPACT